MCVYVVNNRLTYLYYTYAQMILFVLFLGCSVVELFTFVARRI